MDNLASVLAYFQSAEVFGIKPGLARIEALLAKLGNPQEQIPAIQIAGTNGKGSVSAMLTAIAAFENKRVGWYTSPALEVFNDRIRLIDGRQAYLNFCHNPASANISDQDLIIAAQTVKVAADQLVEEGMEPPTEFELVTATAFCFFAKSACEILILETGLGGRLDATNVIAKPLVSIITALAYDHTNILGSHLTEIAGEKAGIIKAGCPVIALDPQIGLGTGGEAAEAACLIERIAKAKDSPFKMVYASDFGPGFSPIETASHNYTQSFCFQGQEEAYKLAMLADYQRYNAGLAILAGRYFASEESIRQGLAQAIWPGRFEFLAEDPPVLIDGAHNLQGVQSLSRDLEHYFVDQDLIFVTGMLRDKDHRAMLKEVFQGQKKYRPRLVFVTAPPVERALPAQALAEELASLVPQASLIEYSDRPELDWGSQLRSGLASSELKIIVANSYNELGTGLVKLSKDLNMPLVAFGSLYLIGKLRPLFRTGLAQLVS